MRIESEEPIQGTLEWHDQIALHQAASGFLHGFADRWPNVFDALRRRGIAVGSGTIEELRPLCRTFIEEAADAL